MKYFYLCVIFICFVCVPNVKSVYKQFSDPTRALPMVTPYLPRNPIILEAGAFDGTESVYMASFWPTCTVYSFEPVPELYHLLKNKARSHKNIHTYELALSDQVGTAKFYISESADHPGVPFQSSSLREPKEHLKICPSILFKKETIVKTTTIDNWAKENNVDHIDFLWLDMQGSELNALMASPNIMKTVKAILTEVEFVEAYKGQFLCADVKKWLEKQGFEAVAIDFDDNNRPWCGDILFVRTQNK